MFTDPFGHRWFLNQALTERPLVSRTDAAGVQGVAGRPGAGDDPDHERRQAGPGIALEAARHARRRGSRRRAATVAGMPAAREKASATPSGSTRAAAAGAGPADDGVEHLVDRRWSPSPRWRAAPARPGRPTRLDGALASPCCQPQEAASSDDHEQQAAQRPRSERRAARSRTRPPTASGHDERRRHGAADRPGRPRRCSTPISPSSLAPAGSRCSQVRAGLVERRAGRRAHATSPGSASTAAVGRPVVARPGRPRSRAAVAARGQVEVVGDEHAAAGSSENSRSAIRRVLARSSSVVGSSATSTSGSIARTPASASSWRWPPESACTLRSPSPPSPYALQHVERRPVGARRLSRWRRRSDSATSSTAGRHHQLGGRDR